MKRKIIKWTLYIAVFYLIAVFQFTPAMLPRVVQMGPLPLVPAVICAAMCEGGPAGVGLGVLAGLMWDSQGGPLFGFDALFLMMFGLFAGLLAEYIFRNSILTALLFSLASLFTLEFLTWFFFFYLFGDKEIGFAFFKIILPTVLNSLVYTVPLYFIFMNIRRLTPEE